MSVCIRRIRRVLPFVVLALFVSVVAVAAARGDRDQAPRGLPEDPHLEAEGREQQEQERQRAWRKGPDARRERAASRGAYGGLDRSGAVGVMRQQHGAFLGPREWRPFQLGEGERVERYLADGGAQIELANGKVAVARSSLPMRARDPEGEIGPVDLGLVERGGGFEPRNSLVHVELPARADGSARLKGLEVGLSYEGAAAASGAVEGGSVFYAGVSKDTDLILRPGPLGVGAFVQLRSPASTETPTLHFALPASTRLRRTPTPPSLSEAISQTLQIVRGDEVLATVTPPAAYDAQGEAVPARFRLEGDVATIEVEHRDKDYAYPILVDPWVMDRFSSWNNGTQAMNEGWTAVSSRPGIFGLGWNDLSSAYGSAHGSGQFVYSFESPHYIEGDIGYWQWRAPTNTYIFRADYTTSHSPAALFGTYYSSAFHGILRYGAWETGWWGRMSGGSCCSPSGSGTPIERYPLNNAITITCVAGHALNSNQCDENSGTEGNYAVAGLQMNITGSGVWAPSHGWSDLRSATVLLQDRNTPAITNVSHSNPVPSGWVRSYSSTASATTHDDGLGMWGYSLTTPKVGGGTEVQETGHQCAFGDGTAFSSGNRNSRCPQDWTTPGLSYSTATMPDGENTVSVGAKDIVATHAAPRSWTVKVDRTPPKVDVVGAARDAEGDWLSDGRHTLNVWGGDDDAAGRAGSGIQRLELYADNGGVANRLVDSYAPPCPGGTCAREIDRHLSFNASDFQNGTVSLRVRVVDQVGHAVEDTWSVKLDRDAPTVVQSGDLRVASGETLGAPSYPLVTAATDGSALQPQSGVKSITISVNNWQADYVTQDCPDGSCPLTHVFTYKNEDFGPGVQTITARVVDFAGNQTERSFPVIDASTATTCGNRVVSPSGQPCVEAHTPCTTSSAALPGPSNPPAQPSEIITSQQALASLQGTLPAVIAPSTQATLNGLAVRPTLAQRPEEFLSTGTEYPSAVPSTAHSGIAIGIGPDSVCLKPTATDSAATAPLMVNGDSILFANTSRATDTVIRPTASGAETFLQLRSATAPEAFSWKVDVPAGGTLRQLDARTVAVLGPDPSSGDAPPPPPIPPPASASDPSKIPDVDAQLMDARAELDAADDLTQHRTIATIRAPWARDANGQQVPITLAVSAPDVVSATVAHRNGGFQYPIVADPHVKGRTLVRVETWNIHGGKSSSIAAVGDAMRADNAFIYGIQEICSADIDNLMSRLPGGSGNWRFKRAIVFRYSPTSGCYESNLILVRKDYGLLDSSYDERYIPRRGTYADTEPAPCRGERITTRPPRPRCALKVVAALRPGREDATSVFNTHLGALAQPGEADPGEQPGDRPPDSYRFLHDWIQDRGSGRYVLTGDFNALFSSSAPAYANERNELLSPFYSTGLYREVDNRPPRRTNEAANRTTFAANSPRDGKIDYIFYGRTTNDWVVNGQRVVASSLSDHRRIFARLFVPYYR